MMTELRAGAILASRQLGVGSRQGLRIRWPIILVDGTGVYNLCYIAATLHSSTRSLAIRPSAIV